MNFKQDDDIVYINCGPHYDTGIKFIIIKKWKILYMW